MATDPKPDAVLRAERLLGSAAAWSRVTSGGWSVNEHWLVELENGERAFLKHADEVEPCPTWLRDEFAVYSAIDGPSFLPRLLGWEDGERPLLVLEDLSADGRRPPPWRPGDVGAVLAALPALLGGWRSTPLDGAALLHCDMRSDNLCLRDGRAILFDWSWLPSLALEGGPPPAGAAAVRGFQLAQLEIALPWACRSLGLE